MKRLNQITIGGQVFKIKYVKDDDNFGTMDIDKKVINIRQGLSDEETRRTIFHEAIHATLAIGGLSYLWEDENTEEAIVRALDNIFYPVAKKILTNE